MISHSHKTVFVHVPKCAGQSVEQVFTDDLGLSFEDRAPLLLRRNRDPDMGPHRLAHLYAHEYVGLGHMTPGQYAEYFTFAVVRNPFARLVSEANYRKAAQKKGLFSKGYRSLEHLVKAALRKAERYDRHRHVVPQTRYLYDTDGKTLLVDQVIRFEELPKVFPDVAERVFGRRIELPRRNTTHGNKEWSIKTLSDADIEFIRRFYRQDFDLLGYSDDPSR